jgi:CDGSH-type Zn-finger protein
MASIAYFRAQICNAMASTKITVNDNGSLRIEGDFELVDKTGARYDLGGREIISVCRCGMSQNKPFCDGSHKNHFEHNAVAFALPPKKTI